MLLVTGYDLYQRVYLVTYWLLRVTLGIMNYVYMLLEKSTICNSSHQLLLSTNKLINMKKEKITFFIDKQKFEVEVEQLTVSELFTLAEEDPSVSTLALKHGNDTHKYTDLNEIVSLKNGMKFVVYHNEPTTVS